MLTFSAGNCIGKWKKAPAKLCSAAILYANERLHSLNEKTPPPPMFWTVSCIELFCIEWTDYRRRGRRYHLFQWNTHRSIWHSFLSAGGLLQYIQKRFLLVKRRCGFLAVAAPLAVAPSPPPKSSICRLHLLLFFFFFLHNNKVQQRTKFFLFTRWIVVVFIVFISIWKKTFQLYQP